MAFFKGHEIFSIDEKGRVNIPAKMRKAISPEANDTFVVTRGPEKCVIAYPLDEWKVYEQRFQQLNQHDKENRFFLRTLLMWSDEVSLDSQQRISLPKSLIEFAGIGKKVKIVGVIDHIEFWNPDTFNDYLGSHSDSYEDVAQKVMTV